MYTYTRPPHPTTTGHTGGERPPQTTTTGHRGGKEERVDNLKGRKDHDHPPLGGDCDAAPYILCLHVYIYNTCTYRSYRHMLFIQWMRVHQVPRDDFVSKISEGREALTWYSLLLTQPSTAVIQNATSNIGTPFPQNQPGQPLPSLLDHHTQRKRKDWQPHLPESDAVSENGKPGHSWAAKNSQVTLWVCKSVAKKRAMSGARWCHEVDCGMMENFWRETWAPSPFATGSEKYRCLEWNAASLRSSGWSLPKAAPAARDTPWIVVPQTRPSKLQAEDEHQRAAGTWQKWRSKVAQSLAQNGSARICATSPWLGPPEWCMEAGSGHSSALSTWKGDAHPVPSSEWSQCGAGQWQVKRRASPLLQLAIRLQCCDSHSASTYR